MNVLQELCEIQCLDFEVGLVKVDSGEDEGYIDVDCIIWDERVFGDFEFDVKEDYEEDEVENEWDKCNRCGLVVDWGLGEGKVKEDKCSNVND